MRINRIGTTYIIMVWVLVILLLGTVLLIGYRRNMADLRQLMENEAGQLMDIVSVSARASIHSLDEVEDLSARRLFDNARLIEQLAALHGIDTDHLASVAQANDLHRVDIFDARGTVVFSLHESDDMDDPLKTQWELLRPVLMGDSTEVMFGFSESDYYQGKHYGVIVRRRDGGAVVVQTGSEDMLAFRLTVGLGHLFKEIGAREGVSFIALQDTRGIVAASGGIGELDRIEDDPLLKQALNGVPGTRLTSGADNRLFEIVSPMLINNFNLGVLRIGLHIGTFEAIRVRAIRQFVILFFAAVFSGAFLFIFLMLRQNYRVLDAEHDRILSDVRRMEEDTRRSERLASMGRLAAGVAHEIRNPLNAISIIAQRLKAEFIPAENVDEYRAFLSTIRTEIGRITAIIENFLRYVRPPELKRTMVDIADLAGDTAGVVKEKARAGGVSIDLDIKPGLSCSCDYDQLKQALLNLLLNAIDAAGVGGTVWIRGDRRDRSAIIAVADTGPGIPGHVRARVFDPYFTTKDHGSGLGLSEVHRIISAHGGSVQIEQGTEGGAVFTMSLPLRRDGDG